MGLATTATHVIWLLAVIGAAGLAIDAWFESSGDLLDARHDAHARASERLDTHLTTPRFCWEGDKVRVMAHNGGDATIDTANISFLVDGEVVTGFYSDVGTSDNASFWPPGYDATFNKTQMPVEPDRVSLVTSAGTPVYATKIICPVLTLILVSPATDTMEIGDTRSFDAIGYDQYGILYTPEPYVWSSTCGTVTSTDADSATFTAGTTSGPCLVTATSEGTSGSSTVTISPDPPASLVVSPDPAGVGAGETLDFTATVYDQYGNVNATSPVSWSTTAGSIDADGLLTAQTTAQLGLGVTASTTGGVSDSGTVDVYAAAPQTAVVSPDPVDVVAGATQAFSVVLTDAYGNVNATAPIVWTTDAGSIDASGVLTAQTTTATGRGVTATSGAASDTASVDIIPGDPATIAITPDPTTVEAGGTRSFTAVAYDQYGNVNPTAPIAWSTDAGTIDAAGVLTAQTTAQNGLGVTATSGAASETALVDVWAAAPATALVLPDGAGVTAGGTQAYTATLYDVYGNVNTSATVSWSTNAGSISAAGVLTAQTTAASGLTVTATSGAASDGATVDIIAASPASVTVTPDGAGVTVGTTQQYSAVVYDAYGNVNATATVSWSTDAGSIDSGGLLTASTTAATGRTVTATSGAASGDATVDVWADAPTSVAVSPGPVGVPAGGSTAFTATVRDQHGNLNTTATVSWSTDAGSISAAGVLTAQTTAQTGRSVTATANGVSDGATVDVYPAAVDHITVSPASATVYLNRTQAFTATVYDVYNNVNASAPVTWSATSGSISAAGLYTAPSTGGSATVTATSDGVDGTATVSIRREAHVTAMASFKAGVASDSFRKGTDTVEIRTTVRDHDGVLVPDATVTIEYVNDKNTVVATRTAITDASGIASTTYALPSSASTGAWTARVTSISGTFVLYDSGANTVSSDGFSVTV